MMSVPQYPKREVRKPVFLRALAVHPWGDQTKLTIFNLSYAGCAIRTPQRMRRGDTFQLEVPKLGVIQAQVCWTGLQRAGCKFIDDDARKIANLPEAFHQPRP